jgi:hypothetical protein
MFRGRVLQTLPLAIWAILAGPGLASAEDTRAADEHVLHVRKIKADGPSVLALFRKLSLTEAQVQRLESTIRQLGSDAFKTRASASAEIAAIGPPALPFLKKAVDDKDLEISRRGQALVDQIGRQSEAETALPAAAARLLTVYKPAGAADVLLAYLPFNEDDWVEEEVLNALKVLGLREGRSDPALLPALQSPVPCRRAAAAFVVGRSLAVDERSLARQALIDPHARVRLRAAQGLLAGRDRSAVPTLVALLTDAPLAESWKAEELLYQVAGDQAPSATAGTGGPLDRQKYRDAWAAWWRDHAPSVDLGRVVEGPRYLGLTLLAEMDSNKVWEYGPDGKARWKLDGLLGPMDAQVLPSGRVLIAEYQGQRVTERDLQGNILWTKRINGSPIACQRLADGNTFIATHNSILEVTREGKEVFQRNPGSGLFLFGAQKLANGHVACIANPGILLELDAQGKTIRTIRLGNNVGGWCGVQALPGARFLVSLLNAGKVLELDAAGKTLWECSVAGASHATRLPNGHTLITSMTNRRVVEVDREGKTVSEMATTGRPWRVHRR